jgi:hypothetical protein
MVQFIIPPFPQIETLYLIDPCLRPKSTWPLARQQYGDNSLLIRSEVSSAEPIIPHAATNLARTPHLSVLHRISQQDWDPLGRDPIERLDAIDEIGDRTGIVCSFQHGDEEILIVRVLSEYAQISYESGDYTQNLDPALVDSSRSSYRTAVRERGKLDEADWQTMSNYKGMVVPLEIIEGMREAEGALSAKQEGRVIEVGDVAWKVLQDWYKTAKSEKGEALE